MTLIVEERQLFIKKPRRLESHTVCSDSPWSALKPRTLHRSALKPHVPSLGEEDERAP